MAHKRTAWFGLIVLFMLLSYVVPYTFLSGIDAWYGSFLFWVVAAGVTIVINVLISRAWGD